MINLNKLFYIVVPILIVLGLLLLGATYLGQIVGVIGGVVLIGVIIYVVYRFLKQTFK